MTKTVGVMDIECYPNYFLMAESERSEVGEIGECPRPFLAYAVVL